MKIVVKYNKTGLYINNKIETFELQDNYIKIIFPDGSKPIEFNNVHYVEIDGRLLYESNDVIDNNGWNV